MKQVETLDIKDKIYFIKRKYGAKKVEDSYFITEGFIHKKALDDDGNFIVSATLLNGEKRKIHDQLLNYGKVFLSKNKAEKQLKSNLEKEKRDHDARQKRDEILKKRKEKGQKLEELIGKAVYVKTIDGWKKSTIERILPHEDPLTQFSFWDERYRQNNRLNKEGTTWVFAENFQHLFEKEEKMQDEIKEKQRDLSELETIKIEIKDEIKTKEKEIEALKRNLKTKEKQEKDTSEQLKKHKEFLEKGDENYEELIKKPTRKEEELIARVLFEDDGITPEKALKKKTVWRSPLTIQDKFYTCPRCRTKSKTTKNQVETCPECEQRVQKTPLK